MSTFLYIVTKIATELVTSQTTGITVKKTNLIRTNYQYPKLYIQKMRRCVWIFVHGSETNANKISNSLIQYYGPMGLDLQFAIDKQNIMWDNFLLYEHNFCQVRNHRNVHFLGNVRSVRIGRNGSLLWPPWSPDLSVFISFCGMPQKTQVIKIKFLTRHFNYSWYVFIFITNILIDQLVLVEIKLLPTFMVFPLVNYDHLNWKNGRRHFRKKPKTW